MKNLLKNPAKNGMPPSENTASIISSASFGFDLLSPLNAAIDVSPPFSFSTADITAKAARLENTYTST